MRYLYPSRHAQGFTAIELMVVIAILAILTALAAPSFTGLIERWRVRQTYEELQSTLYYARSEAIRRGGYVTLRKESTGVNGCISADDSIDWNCGWYIFFDGNSNGNFDNGDARLQEFLVSKIKVDRSENIASITFDRWGMPNKAIGFTIFPQGKKSSDPVATSLCMSRGGRIRKIKAVDGSC